jgi:hypothetical protein
VITDVLFEASVDGDGNFPENESVGGYVVKCRLLLLLDRFSESADILITFDLNREDAIDILAEDPTV